MSTELTAGQRALMQATLVRRQHELEQQIAQQLDGKSRPEHARDVLLQDGDDATARDADREVDLARSDREIAELRDVNEALARLTAGTYGWCLDCEAGIPFGRLQRQPQASRCLACQAAEEAQRGRAQPRATI